MNLTAFCITFTLQELHMITNQSNVSFRIDTDLKNEAENLFNQLGLSMTAAYNIFLRQAVREKRIPFDVSLIPNEKTALAMREAERIARDPKTKSFDSFSELLNDTK